MTGFASIFINRHNQVPFVGWKIKRSGMNHGNSSANDMILNIIIPVIMASDFIHLISEIP